MSEIVMRMNPKTGNIEKIQIVADDEQSQLEGLDRLRLYLKAINEFSRENAAYARLYNLFNGERCNDANGR